MARTGSTTRKETPFDILIPFGLDRYEACKNPELGPFGRWICRKSVDGRCKNGNAGEMHICCEADAADCRVAANGDTDQLARCELNKAQCEMKIKEPKCP